MAKKIIVIDDEKIVGDMAKKILQAEGYEVDAFIDSQVALEAIRAQRYDLVITDLKMPLVDGMDLIDIVKKINAALPIIIITAYGTIETAEEAIQKGAYDFITKPFRKETILITIRRALEWKRMQGELAELKKG